MTITVRPTRPEEYRAASEVVSIALMGTPLDDAGWERSSPSWDEMPSLTAWDGDRCVGHAGQFVVDTTVPGGARVPTGAVSRVGVLSSHRRRGVATALMHELVADAHRRNFVLMSLRASEATIYHRFGFGPAGDFCTAELFPDRVRPIRGAGPGSVRILTPNEILDTVAPLYERSATRRVGWITRPPSFWQRFFREAIERTSPTFVAVHTDPDGVDDAYVLYTTKWNDAAGFDGGGVGEVHELFGVDDDAELAMWQYVCDVDLVRRWTLLERPHDDLVRLAARDQRGYRQAARDDEQWVRLVDVDTALSARRYAPVAGGVVVAVSDPWLPHNDGTWRIDADGAARTEETPDLVVGIEGLSMVYLGGPTWSEAAATSRAEVRDRDVLAVADALFATRPSPFCGSFF
jgi:predicted acetyltransferase